MLSQKVKHLPIKVVDLNQTTKKERQRQQYMNLKARLQKLQAILVLELKVARMRVRLAVKFLRKKMTQLSQSIRHS